MEISKQSGKVKEGRRMTEKEVEKAYKKMTESDAPDLWARVESNLPEKEIQPAVSYTHLRAPETR